MRKLVLLKGELVPVPAAWLGGMAMMVAADRLMRSFLRSKRDILLTATAGGRKEWR